jgi:hypothetical protein
MIGAANMKRVTRMQREELRKSLAAPAWSLWTALTKGDVMANSEARENMMERHKVVVALIEVNSQQLRCDSAAAGLDIERLIARRDVEQSGTSAEACAALAAVEQRILEVEEKKRKLCQERDWLETSLSDFDTLATGDTLASGKAPQFKSPN